MAGLGRGGRGQALLEALNQPVRKPGALGGGGAEKTGQATQPAQVYQGGGTIVGGGWYHGGWWVPGVLPRIICSGVSRQILFEVLLGHCAMLDAVLGQQCLGQAKFIRRCYSYRAVSAKLFLWHSDLDYFREEKKSAKLMAL